MKRDITLTVNGTEHELTVEPRTLLIHALRDEMGYTGPNVGCESSMCGACTVHVDGKAVKACTELAVRADGASVTTIEGMGDEDDMHPLQESFQAEHGLQCGYCTPGMVMTAARFLEEEPDPDREEIREALEGNLCRCTGYQNIVNAVESAADEMRADAAATDGGDRVADGGDAVTDGGDRVTDGGDQVADGGDAVTDGDDRVADRGDRATGEATDEQGGD